MILVVTERFHDHEPDTYYLDTGKLDPKRYIDSLILKECKKKRKIMNIFVDASDWEDNPKFQDQEPEMNPDAIFRKDPVIIDKALNIAIDFDC